MRKKSPVIHAFDDATRVRVVGRNFARTRGGPAGSKAGKPRFGWAQGKSRRPADSWNDYHAEGQGDDWSVDGSRERMGREIFASWEQRDIEDLVRLTRKFANDINGDRPMIRGTPN